MKINELLLLFCLLTYHYQEPPYDISNKVLEKLMTSGGTEFYVLKEAEAEDGELNDEAEKGNNEEDDGENTFLTEVAEQMNEADMPDFIQSINIPQALVLEVKKA